MQYRQFGDALYIRMDKGDEIIEKILEVCRTENIRCASFSGIGGCSKAEIQTFIPEKGAFYTHEVSEMLELVSLCGNVTAEADGTLQHHTHAMFAYLKDGVHRTVGGHIKSITVLYTAEIELRPVRGGTISRKPDAETGTAFWDFE